MKLEDEIRNGIIISGSGITYRGVFIGKNFFVYRYVDKGQSYRGDIYQEEGYVLAWADYSDMTHINPPSFVPLRPVPC